MPARRDALRSTAGEAAGIPSFVDALFAPHRKWVLDAECAKPEYAKYKWVIEKTGGIENPPTVVKLFEVCQRCPVRRECLMDALTEEAISIVGCWGGTMASERLPVMRRIAEQLTEPDEMTFETPSVRPRRASCRAHRCTGWTESSWPRRAWTSSR